MLKIKYFILIILLFFSCSHIQAKPDYSEIIKILSKETITEHFIFHMSPDDSVNINWIESYYDWLVNKIKIYPTKKIHYYKYKNVKQKYLLTGTKGNAIVLFNKIHSIFPFDNHEIVHVLVGEYIGNPPKLFTEGIAVANQTNPPKNDFIPKWGKKPIDEIAYELNKNSQIPPLDSLLIMSKYFKYNENKSYPISGSFVKYLIEKYGLDTFYSFIKNCDWQNSLIEIKLKFKKTYKEELSSCWDDWLHYITFKNNGND